MQDATARRRFLVHAAGLAAAAGAPSAVLAGERRGADAFAVPATSENLCATCVFWGGQRRVSRDGDEVHVKTLGYCNNPKSPNFRKMTSPNTGPMSAWVKWPALG